MDVGPGAKGKGTDIVPQVFVPERDCVRSVVERYISGPPDVVSELILSDVQAERECRGAPLRYFEN